MIENLKEKVFAGEQISREEAILLATQEDKQRLYKAAGEIRDHFTGRVFDTCSIVNARSGRCSENCKWCAQSAVFKTDIEEYELIDEKTCLELAHLNAEYGVDKFSFVTSGRALSDRNIDKLCGYAVKIKQEADIHLCASMGLLGKEQLRKLMDAGITRYHCNLETSPRYFETLCSTHTSAEKIATIRAAQEIGMEVCSGGIIGMGETMEDRIDLALTLRKLGIKSIPMNILNPIPGTPLEGMAPLTDDEVLTTIALFRFINPESFLRFAGGRMLIGHIETEAIHAGINAAIVGDLLTTVGSKVKEDNEKVKQLGFTLMSEQSELLKYDREHIWHPYTSTIDPLPVYPVKRAEGVYIELEDGRRLIDGMSSWWCEIHGYNHPVLNAALEKQIKEMSHIMFGGFTHRPAVELARKILSITPEGLDKIFFCDSGSVSVEVAMKMALQYWYAAGKEKKSKFLTLTKGYHGDTWNAMSVCDPVTGMHGIFHGNLPVHYFINHPECRFGEMCTDEDIRDFRECIEKNHDHIAAVILEPIVQGAGGMWFYSAGYLQRVRELCDRYGVLLICDEIATGFGRTGKLWAVEHAGISPDIMCIGKSITGGYMSFAATLATEKVATVICSKDPFVFMHGPTFMGNPLACAVANASVGLLMSYDLPTMIGGIERQLEKELAPAREMEQVADVRVLGAIGVVEMKQPVDMGFIQAEFVKEGVWVRPFGRLIYIMPPFIIKPEELQGLTSALMRVVSRL